MHPSAVTDLKTFLPTKDAELSKKFYTDLGFTINWSNEQIAELQIGAFRFCSRQLRTWKSEKRFHSIAKRKLCVDSRWGRWLTRARFK
jgi:predicted lactoylglutathione lyase